MFDINFLIIIKFELLLSIIFTPIKYNNDTIKIMIIIIYLIINNANQGLRFYLTTKSPKYFTKVSTK